MLQVMDDNMEPVRAVPMSADSDGEYEASMYSETQARVKLQHALSQSYKPNIGIRQCDCFSPLILTLFIYDLSDGLCTYNSNTVQIGNIELSHVLFADDLSLMSESHTSLPGLSISLNKCDHQEVDVNMSNMGKCVNISMILCEI
jgi:hypothetical protein